MKNFYFITKLNIFTYFFKYPFDKQYCSLVFRSTAYQTDQLLIENGQDDLELFENGYESEFDVITGTTSLNFSNVAVNPKEYFNASVFRADIKIKRKMVFYLSKIILPYFMFYVVTIFTYLLPVESGEKKSYSTSNNSMKTFFSYFF